VLEFGQDYHREKFIFVDELTIPEASLLLQQANQTFTDEQMKYVFKTIGTNPAKLLNLMNSILKNKCTLEEFVEDVLAQARRDLLAFVHQRILKALKEYPNGVEPEYFKKQEFKGVDLSYPKQVGIAMKGTNAVIYRIESGVYQLMSTQHRTALEHYDPIIRS
jgi:hypothetical protein